MNPAITLKEAQQKIEHFCAYQDRCHSEVIEKLRSFRLSQYEIDDILVKLIADNFLNETRFACNFARGKHRIKQWGKVRIVNELKLRQISQYNITQALKEIDEDDYLDTFENLAQKTWYTITEKNSLKKRKKFCDSLLRKGYESDLVYEKVKTLENMDL